MFIVDKHLYKPSKAIGMIRIPVSFFLKKLIDIVHE